jgi:hypothetical protein
MMVVGRTEDMEELGDAPDTVKVIPCLLRDLHCQVRLTDQAMPPLVKDWLASYGLSMELAMLPEVALAVPFAKRQVLL